MWKEICIILYYIIKQEARHVLLIMIKSHPEIARKNAHILKRKLQYLGKNRRKTQFNYLSLKLSILLKPVEAGGL